MTTRPFTLSEAFSEGWRLTKEHLGFLIAYQIIMFFLIALFSGTEHFYNFWPIHTLGGIVAILVKMGLYKSSLLILDGIKPGYDQLYSNWRHFLSWLVAGFLFGLMFLLGLVLFIVPGFYVLARFGLFPYFILDKDLGPIDALKQASEASKSALWPLFLLFISCIALDILGVLFFGIGLLITGPITILALGYAYRVLRQ